MNIAIIFAGGTGNPYFSTDTGVVLRAIEVDADLILLAKAVDGVYDDDPRSNPDARKYDEITIHEVIDKNLQVMDMTASILARDNKMPMWVFGLNEENSIVNTIKGNFTLPNEIVVLRYIHRNRGMAANVDKNHVISGGLLSKAVRKFCTPLMRNGSIANIFIKYQPSLSTPLQITLY